MNPPSSMPASLDLSIIVPVFNEEQSLVPLCSQLTAVLSKLGKSFEIIFINDGSSDGSYAALCRLAQADPRVKVINLRRNFGLIFQDQKLLFDRSVLDNVLLPLTFSWVIETLPASMLGEFGTVTGSAGEIETILRPGVLVTMFVTFSVPLLPL